jgi:hypothetical protein
MLVKINIGGVDVYFGSPQAVNKPAPFFPYLLEVDTIRDTTGTETGSVAFTMLRRAQSLISLNLRRRVQILNDDLSLAFEGVVGRIAYSESIRITVEA